MKRRYLLIHDCELTPATQFNIVWLGDGQQDKTLKQRLETLSATDTDWYFKPYDWQACEFIQRIADQFNLFYSQLKVRQLDANQTKRTCLPAHVINLSNYHHQTEK